MCHRERQHSAAASVTAGPIGAARSTTRERKRNGNWLRSWDSRITRIFASHFRNHPSQTSLLGWCKNVSQLQRKKKQMKLRNWAALVALLAIACLPVGASGDYYKLEGIRRIDSNLYSATSGSTKLIIETKYCYEYAYGEDGILKYDPPSDSKIIFDDNSTCDVVKVMTK